MIYVSHRLDEVFEIADRMVILRDGRVVGERATRATSPEEVILLIVGREPSQVFRRPAQRAGAARLRPGGAHDRRCRTDRLRSCTRARCVGLVGLRGAGQESVGRALFGLAAPDAGRVLLDGTPIAPTSPRAGHAGRHQSRLRRPRRGVRCCRPSVSARTCSSTRSRPARTRCPYLAPTNGSCARHASSGRRSALRPNDPALPIEWLSGGNQQKVVVGRWLHLSGKVYVFEDPTAGVDVGAKAEIYRLFDVALKGGAAILLVSTDFEEVAKVCHRALVFDRGRVVAELAAADLSAENLLAAASASVGQMAEALTLIEPSSQSHAVP